MTRKLPPLNSLRTFEAAARLGSFMSAGNELCVSHSAISHQVKKLEQYLGVELFSREAKGVKLTEAGQEYYPTVRAAFDRIADSTANLVAPNAPGVLTVQVYSTFAIRWLIPRLPHFQARHPRIQVRLHTSQSDVNFEHEDVDFCVLIGQPSHADMQYDYLFSSRIFPVCSPSLLNGPVPLRTPEDLHRHTLLQVYPSRKDWLTWLKHVPAKGANPNAGQQFDSYELAWNTAAQGLGIALGMEPLVNRDLESGMLAEVFPGLRIHTEGDWYLACQKEKVEKRSFRIFRQWFLEEIAGDAELLRSRTGGADSAHRNTDSA